MPKVQEFSPDWASAPGDTIADILAEQNLSVAEFARRMEFNLQSANELLEGRGAITIGVARRLERILGASVEFWMTRDYQFRQDLARRDLTDQEWLAEFPMDDMIELGWIQTASEPSNEVATILRFFDVPSVHAWRDAYARVHELVAFRTSPSFESRTAAVAAWLRQGEIESESVACGPWDPARFRQSLSSIRRLTRLKDPTHFLPRLKEICAESGVAAVVVRAPIGCRASGATRLLSHEKALLLLSFRHLTDDHFWFSFFHEAGHLILHTGSGLILEGLGHRSNTQEQEANDFAATTLIPAEFQPELLRLPADARAVIRFAVSLGVSPGVVVGQLQHFGKIRSNQLNRLKRRFTWQD